MKYCTPAKSYFRLKRDKYVLGSKIKQLRQARGWTQEELASQIGVKQKQISSYERGTSNPTTDVLIKIAQVFEVSLDYLALNGNAVQGAGNIKDRELLQYFEAIDNFPDEQKQSAKQLLDLIVMKNRLHEMAGK
mgnify:CR=1 FL=1